jgi:hypothetical protein
MIRFGWGRHGVVAGADDERERPRHTDGPLSDFSPADILNMDGDHVTAGRTDPTGVGSAVNRSH